MDFWFTGSVLPWLDYGPPTSSGFLDTEAFLGWIKIHHHLWIWGNRLSGWISFCAGAGPERGCCDSGRGFADRSVRDTGGLTKRTLLSTFGP
jgi:hypothetical protein